jgi:acetylornithine deacetylase
VHVGVIEGGTAKNIIPRRCAFQWETRLLPTADPDHVPHRFDTFARSLEPAMKAMAPEAGISTETVNHVPGLAPESESPAEHLALHLANANSTHAVSYCTEAGLFQQMRPSSRQLVICGPGSIEQAHKPRRIHRHIGTAEVRSLHERRNRAHCAEEEAFSAMFQATMPRMAASAASGI